MPIRITLVSQGRVVALPDPAGGQFDAAGNFDRLLPMENQLPMRQSPNLPLLSRIEAYVGVEFTSDEMVAVAEEAATLFDIAKPGPETRGLERLRSLAEHGAQIPGAVLRVAAD